MRQNGEHVNDAGGLIQSLPGGETRHGIAAEAGMGEDVTFRVPFGFLRDIDECFDFWEMFNPTGIPQEIKATGRGHAFGGPLEPFFTDTFDGQFTE